MVPPPECFRHAVASPTSDHWCMKQTVHGAGIPATVPTSDKPRHVLGLTDGRHRRDMVNGKTAIIRLSRRTIQRLLNLFRQFNNNRAHGFTALERMFAISTSLPTSASLGNAMIDRLNTSTGIEISLGLPKPKLHPPCFIWPFFCPTTPEIWAGCANYVTHENFGPIPALICPPITP
jgi:hypothetical protein